MTEWEIIQMFARGTKGIGDDCAVISKDATTDWLVTTDALYEGVHFRREWTDFETLGAKALLVNISDIAAMGGTPRFYLVSIGLSSSDQKHVEAIAAGMARVAKEAGVSIIGGDTCRSESGLVLSITVIGDVLKGKAVLRSGAKPGDVIFVSGTLGGSALGLECLKQNRRDRLAEPFLARHRCPPLRLALGQQLAATGLVTSMIDVSDGLIADLGHIADLSGVGFEIMADAIPLDPELERLVQELGCDSVLLKLTGGEDYELAFTVANANTAAFAKKAARIGTVVADKKRRVALDAMGQELPLSSAVGFDHFGGR